MKLINKCRLCKGRLRYALKMKSWDFMFCEKCTLLQRQDDMLYQIDFNFEGRYFELPYFPAFLQNKNLDPVHESVCMFFTLKAISYLLSGQGYTVTQAVVKGETLHVSFDKSSSLQKLVFFEDEKRFDNKFTYFLFAIQQKKEANV